MREKWGLTILSQGARILRATVSQSGAGGQNGLSPFLAPSSMTMAPESVRKLGTDHSDPRRHDSSRASSIARRRWTERSVPIFRPCRELSFAALLLFLTSCGYPGPVLPPNLDIPLSVPYVNAIEYGDKIVVEFTLPDLTTEGNPLRNVRLLEVGVGPGPSPFNTERWAETAKRYPVANPAPGPFTKEIPVADWVNKDVVISVRAVGPKGKPSQWATVKLLSVQPPLPKPAALDALNVEQGIKLTWKGTAPKYRIYRALADATPERLNESDHPEFIDETTEYDKTYQYLVQAITDDLHGSEVSAPKSVATVDTFAPAVPGALTAILGVNTIELAWTRNTEKDFRGYNVYRSTDGGPFEKIADLVPAPAFSDNKIEAGKKYRYEVSAVDLKGNESAHSTPADASNQ
jgi:hypothetical protein